MNDAYRHWTQTSAAYRAYAEASEKCAEAFATTTPKPDVNEWRHPGTGERRLYINNLLELSGLEYNQYKSGNISSAILDGDYISNTKATEVRDWLRYAKVWLDEEDTLHLKAGAWEPRAMDSDDLLNRVRQCLRAHGITNQ